MDVNAAMNCLEAQVAEVIRSLHAFDIKLQIRHPLTRKVRGCGGCDGYCDIAT
jgi:hypothetical protein